MEAYSPIASPIRERKIVSNFLQTGLIQSVDTGARICQGMGSAFKFLECTIFQALTENGVFISTQFRSFFLGMQK